MTTWLNDDFWCNHFLLVSNFWNTVSEDPYYCGLSARVPKFDRVVPLKKSNKNQNVIVPKRMSVAYLQHPMIFAAAPPATNAGFPAVNSLFCPSFFVIFTTVCDFIITIFHFHFQFESHSTFLFLINYSGCSMFFSLSRFLLLHKCQCWNWADTAISGEAATISQTMSYAKTQLPANDVACS